ncbi:hypothetical protein TNCV_5135361 [Trichonephila clavipes]|nr:hypothetical protein TNCV_5135361 [Trichonephila clavipes]
MMGVTQIKKLNSADSKVVARRQRVTARKAAVAEKVENLIRKDRRLTKRETAVPVEIRVGSSHSILCDHVQNGCEICSQASVGGTEKLRLAHRTYWILSTFNLASCDFWSFPKKKI